MCQYDVVDFLNLMLDPEDDLCKSDVRVLRKELGSLSWDECYAYAPAPPVKTDGPREPSKGKLIPYVTTIGQLVAPVKIAESVRVAR